jgi:transposase-like protein
MTPPADTERYKNHRFPGEIISHGVWLYYRFTLSYRDKPRHNFLSASGE